MKSMKLNRNIMLFLFYLVFLAVGICSNEVLRPVGGSIWRLINGQYDVVDAKTTIDSSLTDELTYHDFMLELNGLRENLLGTRVILKDDTIIVKSDSGSLLEPEVYVDDADIWETVGIIKQLQNISEANGAEFLYCAAPQKALFEPFPENIPNPSPENYHTFLSSLATLDVPYINLAETLEQSEYDISKLFYYTDHHWTTRAGFLATNAICEELHIRYCFDYSEEYTDISQYAVTTYPNWFLGSMGKKTGAAFTSHGADDFELLIPKFATHLFEEQPFKQEFREGCFEDSVLYAENMKKDYHNVNTYATYGGGDFRLQIIRNNLNREGAKVVIVRDSFACVVTPFLALHTAELHVCDVRDGDYYMGGKVNIEEYIEQVQPDYVIVLYTGVDDPVSSRYDFFTPMNNSGL